MLSECDHPMNLTRYHNFLNFIFLLVINHDRTGLWRLWAFCNLIRDVGADDGDGYDRVDVFLPCGAAELDSGWGDDLCDGTWAGPFLGKLLLGVIGGVI